MRRRTICLLLCAALTFTAAPALSTGASYAGAAEPVLAYVPLDNRPVNVDRVIYEAESAIFRAFL